MYVVLLEYCETHLVAKHTRCWRHNQIAFNRVTHTHTVRGDTDCVPQPLVGRCWTAGR